MVLQSSNVHLKRYAAENTPPPKHSSFSQYKHAKPRTRPYPPGSPRVLAAKKTAAHKKGVSLRASRLRRSHEGALVGPANADVEMIDLTLPATNQSAQQTINLSRHLGYPGHKNPSREALAAIGVDESMNMAYFKEKLAEMGPEMLECSASIRTSPTARLPKQIEVTASDARHLPTHMLALWGNFQTHTERCKVAMHPVHNSVLSTYCANLPPLPTPEMPSHRCPGVKYTVPVVPLGVPSPTTFPRLCTYLYTKDHVSLFQSFFPMVPGLSPLSDMDEVEGQALRITEFARRLASTYTSQVLLVRAMAVKGMWANTCALGVSDYKLSAVLDLAWEVYINALAMSTKTPVNVEPPAATRLPH